MTNDLLIRTLRQFLASEDKPKGCQPIDQLQVIRLLLQQASDEKRVSLSRGTLALQLGCGESTIYESQKRLKKSGWLEVRKGKRQFCANEFTVLTDNLPLAEQLKRTVVTDKAREVAEAYFRRLWASNPRRKFKKAAQNSYAFRIQTLLDKCKGDAALLVDIIRFAFQPSSGFAPKAMRGPHELRRSWKSLKSAFDSARRRELEATAQASVNQEIEELCAV